MKETDREKIYSCIQRKYRKELWTPFVKAVKTYGLLSEGDRVAVCISGGKDSFLLAALMKMLQRFSDFPFETRYICLDPGFAPGIRDEIKALSDDFGIDVSFTEGDIFRVCENHAGDNPCYLCARMRRGYLYSFAKEQGCNKIALGHHLSDVIETTVMGMFWGSQLQGMLPKLRSTNYEGMELIRPLYMINERDIIAWAKYLSLAFPKCACAVAKKAENGEMSSKRQETKELIEKLRKTNPNIENNIFNSIHKANIDTLPGYKLGNTEYGFSEIYERNGKDREEKKEE